MKTTAITPAPLVSRATTIWTLAGLVLLTVNLRAAITGISPLLGDLRDGFGLSGVEVSILTTLPVLCLGLFASLAPVLAKRVGAETAIVASLLLITLGILLRVVPFQAALFAGTVLAGAGIAMGNVLTPAVVKHIFPERVGSLTGLAMMLMAASGAIAAGLAVPLDAAGGWRVALAVWAVPSLIAALAWGPLALRGRRRARGHDAPGPERGWAEGADAARGAAGERSREAGREGGPSGGRSGGAASPPAGAEGSLLRSAKAWYVSVFMGLASLMFYVLMSWLPEIMRDDGHAPATGGLMISTMMIIGIPLGLVVPVFAARLRDQRVVVVGVVTAMFVGIGGLVLAPAAGWIWVVTLGIGTGSAFPLAFTLLSLRSPSPSVAARLSGMAQTTGYLLAGFGPLAFGVLHSATGGWDVSLTLLLLLVAPELVFGLLAARSGFIRPSVRRPEGHLGHVIESEAPEPASFSS